MVNVPFHTEVYFIWKKTLFFFFERGVAVNFSGCWSSVSLTFLLYAIDKWWWWWCSRPHTLVKSRWSLAFRRSHFDAALLVAFYHTYSSTSAHGSSDIVGACCWYLFFFLRTIALKFTVWYSHAMTADPLLSTRGLDEKESHYRIGNKTLLIEMFTVSKQANCMNRDRDHRDNAKRPAVHVTCQVHHRTR